MIFPDYHKLNEREQRFFACLEAASSDSIWGLAIKNVVKDPTIDKYRRLICDLKAQRDDCSEIMLSILGKSCYNQLINL